MLYSELTGLIISSVFDVSNELGSGFLESVYEKALVVALREKEFKVVEQCPLMVYYHGEMVGQFYADIVVEDKILLELKTVSAILPEHKAQIINYLKATGLPVGLLINFGSSKAEVRRFDLKKDQFIETRGTIHRDEGDI